MKGKNIFVMFYALFFTIGVFHIHLIINNKLYELW